MAHHHRRNAAYSGTWPAADTKMDDKTDYIASRVRSREEKDAAAREAQRRAAANRDEVLRETARITQKGDRNEQHTETRQRALERSDSTHHGTNDSDGAHEQSRNAVRFSSPPGRPEDLRGRTTERKKRDSSGDQPHGRRSPQPQGHAATSTSWTSRLKAFTSSSHEDRPARTETSTTISQDHHHHHSHRRRRSKERVRPQEIPSTSQPTYATQSSHPRPQLQTSAPPPQPPFPTMPPPHPAPHYPHITQSASGDRIDVYLNAGPSDWHVGPGSNNMTSASSNPPQPPFPPPPPPPAHLQPPAFPAQSSPAPPPPPPHLRNPDFFGPIAMHLLQNMQHPAHQHQQHQHHMPQQPQHHIPQQPQQPQQPQSQPQRGHDPPPRPPKVPHESVGTGISTSPRNAPGQAQGQQPQQQTPPSQPHPPQQAYPVPKNRMPVWDDQTQAVRWEWR